MLAVVADAQQLRQEAFELINLDYPGLEKVKAACSRQKWEAAAQELLNYYRSRTGITSGYRLEKPHYIQGRTEMGG